MNSKNILCVLLLAALTTACGGGSDDDVLVQGDFPIAYVERNIEAVAGPADGVVFSPGGDLIIQSLSSPQAGRRNVTRVYTRGAGDVSGPEASYDGRRVVFSMRGPEDATWSIWEYELSSGSLRRVIADDVVAEAGDDLDPHYLPDGRIVFASNRQQTSRALLEAAGIEPYAYRDGYGREAALVLHVMDADGGDIQQISFNQSHDRNPTVRMDGTLMYARWDHMGNRNHHPVFTANPDGTRLDVLYGAFSPGTSFLHPRELPDGRVLSTLVPLSGTWGGGALVVADVRHFSDARVRVGGGEGQGQHQATLYELPLSSRLSPFGRYTTPYPLWDGTQRALVAWSAWQRDDRHDTSENPPRYGIYMLDLAGRFQRPIALPPAGKVYTDPVALMPRPRPAIFRSELPDEAALQTAVAAVAPRPYPCVRGGDCKEPPPEKCPRGGECKEPPPEKCPRGGDCKEPPPEKCPRGGDCKEPPPEKCPRGGDCKEPPPGKCPDGSSKPYPDCKDPGDPGDPGEPGDPGDPGDPGAPGEPANPDPPAPLPLATLNIKSVYQTGFLGSMGDGVLAEGESIPRGADGEPDLVALRDAARTTAAERPARFLRITRALPTPPGLGVDTIGATAFKMQQILGYAPIEPDGSVRVRVPADTPLSLAVVDSEGRAFQTHTNWLQVRPGEERTCAGCHDHHRDRPPLNRGTAGGPFEGSRASFSARAGETMAETRTRIDPDALVLSPHLDYVDVWTDPAVRTPDRSRSIDYSRLQTTAPRGGLINYPEHIQPLWEHAREGGSCVSCHNGAGLDLRAEPGPNGRLRSYDALLRGQMVRDPNSGEPDLRRMDERLVIRREAPLVDVGGSGNSSRSSRLIEKLYERELNSSRPLPPATVDHSEMFLDSELRLLAEWIDLGAAYYNDPWLPGASDDGLRSLSELRTQLAGLNRESFAESTHGVLMRRCAGCHQPVGHSGDVPEYRHLNPPYAPNRFVLSGRPDTDFEMARIMVNDACQAEASPLLRRPVSTEESAAPHPRVSRAGHDGIPVLDYGGEDYMRLLNWIATGCL